MFALHKFKHKAKRISSIPATINHNEIYNLTFAVIQLKLKKILRVGEVYAVKAQDRDKYFRTVLIKKNDFINA